MEYNQCSRCGQFVTHRTKIGIGNTLLGLTKDDFYLCNECFTSFEIGFIQFLQDKRKLSKDKAKDILKTEVGSSQTEDL